jgi:multiple sugar transport system ATP-binding protein
MAKVRLDGVTKKFKEVVAVDNVSLNINDKEFIMLLGPSGCGKTTTLRLIAGLEKQDSGDIYIGDTLVNDLTPRERNIAMVFQSYALYPHMTVYDNMAFPLKLRKVPNSEIKEKVEKTSKILRTEDLLKRTPAQLSGGQQQRVALGRAIIRDPDVFLLDEPLSNLDARLRVSMRSELKALQRELGVTTIYVTHDQVEAMTMSQRIAVMNEGKVQQLDAPVKTYLKPASAWVGSFIGSPAMNLFDCAAQEKNGRNMLVLPEFSLDLSNLGKVFEELPNDIPLILGVRPEDITVHKEKRPESVEATIYVTEPIGGEIIVDVKIGKTDEIYKAIVGSDFNIPPGEKVYLEINKNKIHVFDKKTGKAII